MSRMVPFPPVTCVTGACVRGLFLAPFSSDAPLPTALHIENIHATITPFHSVHRSPPGQRTCVPRAGATERPSRAVCPRREHGKWREPNRTEPNCQKTV